MNSNALHRLFDSDEKCLREEHVVLLLLFFLHQLQFGQISVDDEVFFAFGGDDHRGFFFLDLESAQASDFLLGVGFRVPFPGFVLYGEVFEEDFRSVFSFDG